MAITVKHKYVSAIPDSGDTTIVQPSNWNDDHQLVGTVPVDNGGTGATTLTGYVKGNGTSAMTASSTIPSTDVSGLGTIATQNANAVAITGGNIDGTTIGGTTPAVITGSTINANTKVVSPDFYAQSVLGGNLRTYTGTSLVNWDGGGSGNVTINGGLLANPANKNVSIAPTGTGTATINPATAGAMDNMVIGATTPKAITGTTVTATTFSGSGASLTSIPNSALVNSAITINGNSTALGGSVSVGTVTSVTATAPVASTGGTTPVISMPAATTSVSGYLTSTDWNTFNGKQPAGTYINSVSGTTNQITASTVSGATTVSLPATVTTGAYVANESITSSLNQGAFAYGTLGYSDINIYGSYTSSANAYAQKILQNTGSGVSSSADFVISNNLGTASTYYGDLGITSSTYNTVGQNIINTPNTVYLQSVTTPLAIGTLNSFDLSFYTNGTLVGSFTAAGVFTSASVALTGGSINNTTVGATTASTGRFTTLAATGVFTASAGTAALPSIVTASGATTGLFSSTANVLGFAVSAAQVGTVTSTGLNAMAVGATTASTGAFTTLSANNTVTFSGTTTNIAATSQTTGTLSLGGASQTGILTLGQSTVSQTTNIQAGATASASTKTINIGTGGLTGSTTTMAIGSAFGTTVTANGTWNYIGNSSSAALKTPNIKEVATVSATAATGTIAYDATTQSVVYYTTAATGNFTMNFRGSAGTTMNTIMNIGESMSFTFLNTNGATPFYNSAIQVDGTTTGVTTKWQGAAPTAGNANSIDAYSYVIIKTAASTYTVLASQTKFA